MKKIKFILLAIFALGKLSLMQAQGDEASAIANKLQNPLARISALPIQHNIGLGSPALNGASYTMSMQPIIGTEYEKINVVHRAVFGVSYLPSNINGGNPTFGMTDLNYSFLVAPKSAGKVAWGVGPSIDIPTATDPILGGGKWNAGISAVLVYQTPKITIDLVLRQTTSFAGDSERPDANLFVAQTLLAYNLGKGWMLSTFPTIQANWSAEKGQQWTVPVGGGVSKVAFLGKLPVSVGVQYYQNVIRPDGAPKGELRFSTTFVFGK